MMIFSQLPQIKNETRLVIDASVAINLLGTGMPAEILRAFKHSVVIEEIAYREVERDPFLKTSGPSSLDKLINEKLLLLERLTEDGFELFLQLTGAEPPDDLGDGEAATIAHATMTKGITIIDEKKGSRILRQRNQAFMSTLDLLRSTQSKDGLSQVMLADAVHAALIHARMRVPHEHRHWVMKLLGNERSCLCPTMMRSLSK